LVLSKVLSWFYWFYPLTFDRSTAKWGDQSLMGFLLATFQLVVPFSTSLLDLGSGTGQTDGRTNGQTDREAINGHQRLMPHPIGVGHNNALKYTHFHSCVTTFKLKVHAVLFYY